jgi:hypothetical protein
LKLAFPLGNNPHAFDLVNGLILNDSCPFPTLNSAIPELENEIGPTINLVKSGTSTNWVRISAYIGQSPSTSVEKYKYGNTKNLKQAAEEMGCPGNPKKAPSKINQANMKG